MDLQAQQHAAGGPWLVIGSPTPQLGGMWAWHRRFPEHLVVHGRGSRQGHGLMHDVLRCRRAAALAMRRLTFRRRRAVVSAAALLKDKRIHSDARDNQLDRGLVQEPGAGAVALLPLQASVAHSAGLWQPCVGWLISQSSVPRQCTSEASCSTGLRQLRLGWHANMQFLAACRPCAIP